MHKNQMVIIGVVLTLGILTTVTAIYMKRAPNQKSTPTEYVYAPTEEEIRADNDKTAKFNDLTAVANGNDSTLKISESLQYARDGSNDIKARLDAYRLCLQTAIELGDTTSKESCYNESSKLTEELTLEDERVQWKNYLENIYNGRDSKSGAESDVTQ